MDKVALTGAACQVFDSWLGETGVQTDKPERSGFGAVHAAAGCRFTRFSKRRMLGVAALLLMPPRRQSACILRRQRAVT